MRSIRLNFLPFTNQDLGIIVYRKKFTGSEFSENASYYNLPDENGTDQKFEILHEAAKGYDEYKLPPYLNTGLIARKLFDNIKGIAGFDSSSDNEFDYRLFTEVEKHPKGKKCIWIEPYFLKSKKVWGVRVGFKFVVDPKFKSDKFKIDKEILIASGTLNSKGLANFDYYLFRHSWLSHFIKVIVPKLNEKLTYKLKEYLFEVEGHSLKPKQYVFNSNTISQSPYLGLVQHQPLQNIEGDLHYLFLYKQEDRDYAASLLRGLRGQTFPSVFAGMEKVFKTPFPNERIRGVSVRDFDDTAIQEQIKSIKESRKNTLPIIVAINKKEEDNERIYYFLKHRFTNAGIPCQVVTKELITNDNALKYSLGNIALQMFAKAGGKPWKMKTTGAEGLIIGIGQSYNIEKTVDGNTIEKNITYSILTDSSGLFKDLKVLSEGLETDADYYEKIVTNISAIITSSQYKKVTVHVPFRISKDKIIQRVASMLAADVELTVLVINNKTDHLGFDYENNGLVPFESTFIKLSNDEYLVWFEGLSPSNPKITKRFGNPLSIKFWYTNKSTGFTDFIFRENLLQDCINLSGANWRGFKAKQLPVSIFYCQRIAEFISKFREYHLDHIEINNLKPWFL